MYYVASTKTKVGQETAESKRIFRYWVKIREFASGSVRIIPLSTWTRVPIPRKANETTRQPERYLKLEDVSSIVEARDLAELVVQLRALYPDAAYERTLHWERDFEAEKRRAEAVSTLAEILLPRAYLEALYVIQGEMERGGTDPSAPDIELERLAARRGIELIDAGRWKQRDTWVHFPPSWIRQILESFVCGELSLGHPTPSIRVRKNKRMGKTSRNQSADPAGQSR